jgi:hypothetical protein
MFMMNKINLALRKPSYHYIAIVIYTLITHGLLLLNNGVYWDGWLMYTNLIEKNWNNIHTWLFESGAPISAYFHWVMGYLPTMIFSYKLVAFLSITLSGILVYTICNELRLLSRTESLFIALLSVSYPAFQVSVELVTIPYLAYYCLFLLACFLALRSEKMDGFRHYCLRVGSLALWVLSFTLNSLLVFYYGFLLVLILHARYSRNISPKHVFTGFLPRRLDYVLLPLLYWVIARHFFPPHGLYSDYNQLSFSPLGIATVYALFVINAVYAQLNNALKNLLNYPAFVLAILLGLLWACSTHLLDSIRFLDKKVNSYALLLFGFVLLALAIFPYAVVGKAASAQGWETRHALLVALPIAIILVAITRLALGDKTGSISKLGLFFLMILLLAFTLSSINNYLSWQARWVKDQSIMENLSTLENIDNVSVFWVDDQFQIDGTATYYDFYEWSSIFKSVWGDESHIGLDQRAYTHDFLTQGLCYFNDRYNLSDFDSAGCQAILTIRRGPDSSSNVRMSMRYLFYKFFRKDSLAHFLHGVTDVQVQPISTPEAVNCPTK